MGVDGAVMDKEQAAIERLKFAAKMSEKLYHAPLIVTTSGGKDSSVCVHLALAAGIDFELMHNLTTADAPETMRFVRQEFKRLEDMGFPSDQLMINYPVYKGVRCSMWSLIPQKLMPPTRLVRYCCSILKERGGQGRYISTGVRWAESTARKNSRGVHEAGREIILNNDNEETRREFENCALKGKRVCNPIVDWTDDEVWDYINSEHIPLNPLYSEGFSRVGCIGCPMAGKHGRERGFARWPGYKMLYIRAFDKMLQERKRRGKTGSMRWGSTAEEVFHWWMDDGILPGQETLFEDDKEAQHE